MLPATSLPSFRLQLNSKRVTSACLLPLLHSLSNPVFYTYSGHTPFPRALAISERRPGFLDHSSKQEVKARAKEWEKVNPYLSIISEINDEYRKSTEENGARLCSIPPKHIISVEFLSTALNLMAASGSVVR